MFGRLIIALPIVLAASSAARAHDVTLMAVDAEVRADGTYRLTLHYDADALMAGTRPEHMTPEDYAALRALPPVDWERKVGELRRYFLIRTRVEFDGVKTDSQVRFPPIDGDRAAPPPATTVAGNPMPGSRILLEGTMPAGAKSFAFWASKSFGTIHLRLKRPGDAEAILQLVPVAETSKPFELTASGPAPVQGRWEVARQFAILGFEHILPMGVDHILFVLGLFLLSARVKPLLWQVTAFTVAHSITLALAMYDVVRLPPSIVEPLIALSIVYVAVENVATSRLHAWRPAVVFLFGLLHGLGFAGVLTELGLPRERFVVALASFNVGVEFGQLSVIALAFLAVGWFRARKWYRPAVTIPASLAIAAVGLYWTYDRTFG